MKERRKEKRLDMVDSASAELKVKQYFRVFNRDTNEFLGYLRDISSKGVMLLSKTAIRQDQKLRLRIELPESIPGNNEWLLTTMSIWCEKDVDPEYYRVGFSILEKPPHLDDLIKSLVEDTPQPKVVGSK
jgi:hypothetical protein